LEPTVESLEKLGKAMASQAEAQILRIFPTLSRAQRGVLVNAFKRQMLPQRKRGRPPNKIVTKAAELWRRGFRGAAFFEQCIPGFRRWALGGESSSRGDCWRRSACGAGGS
jgi:hypothetical protein